jgi:hypothetical protein
MKLGLGHALSVPGGVVDLARLSLLRNRRHDRAPSLSRFASERRASHPPVAAEHLAGLYQSSVSESSRTCEQSPA